MDTKLPHRKPAWLKIRAFGGPTSGRVARLLADRHLDTICQAANCPNRGECFERGTATFLILGPRCTRDCRFCNVRPGKPGPPDPSEPKRIAEAAARMGLRFVVVTSVTRDDLADGGAAAFAATIEAVKERLPEARVEVLVPDFMGSRRSLKTVLAAGPDVFNHNVETVPRLYPLVRPAADYRRSLALLEAAGHESVAPTKSGLMVGLGESRAELREVFDDMAAVGVSILTIGQYLAPSRDHFPVTRYLPPEEFDDLAADAARAGIRHVFSGPLVRSSYMAERAFGCLS
jgi:lipoic acid synthetase